MLDLELFLYNEADLKIHYAYKKKPCVWDTLPVNF